MSRSIDEILTAAFNEIRDTHRLALKRVDFETFDASTPTTASRVYIGAEIEAETLRGHADRE